MMMPTFNLALIRSSVEKTSRMWSYLLILFLIQVIPNQGIAVESGDGLINREHAVFLRELILEEMQRRMDKLIEEKKWAEASVQIQDFLDRYPDYIGYEYQLANILTKIGRREEALRRLNLKMSELSRGDAERVKERVKTLSRLFLSKETQAMLQQAINYMQAEKYGEAQRELSQALAKENDNVEILTRLGQVLLMNGDADSASERLKKARRLNPYEPEIELWLGRALYLKGESKEAEKRLKSGLMASPSSEQGAIWLAEIAMLFGEEDRAVKILEQSIAEFPFHLYGLMALARHQFYHLSQQGKISEPLWEARRNLQLALSRYHARPSQHEPIFGNDLSFRPLRTKDQKEEIARLLEEVERRIQSRTEG
jgi:predicted Zn-dependent protease